jgi:hypothetical protein
MSSRHGTHSLNGSDEDDHPPPYGTSSGQPYNRSVLNDDPFVNRGEETRPLLDGYKEESSSGSCFTNIPARYIIAIWAFFGFICLYSMRVNLSVAIVAMVSFTIFQRHRIHIISR